MASDVDALRNKSSHQKLYLRNGIIYQLQSISNNLECYLLLFCKRWFYNPYEGAMV